MNHQDVKDMSIQIFSILGNIGAKVLEEAQVQNAPAPVVAVPDPVRMKLPLNKRYLNLVFDGSTFPDDPYEIVPVKLNDTIKTYYLPALEKALPGGPKGLKLLITAMTHQEGFLKKSRSFRTNNPGNIGNTDSGANRGFKSLSDGIKAQADHIIDISDGAKYYPLGKALYIEPYYSKEIAKNPTYGLPYNLPGYRFTYTGQLDQFVKIYSTGARATNAYVNTIVSYFKISGIDIRPDSTIADIISRS